MNFGCNRYDYGARMYDAQLGRWHCLDPLAEEYYSQSTYHFSGNNPIRFVDYNGMNYGDFYDRRGRHIGTDGINDGKKYIVLDNSEAANIRRTNRRNGTTQRSSVGSSIQKPSQDVMNAANTAVQNTDNTGNEYGFVAATDGTTSSIITNNSGGQVRLGPGYMELEGQGRQTSFDVHTHPDDRVINPDGTVTAGDHNPSGTPGTISANDDYGYRGMKENRGQVNEPSWVIGTDNLIPNPDGSGNLIVNSNPQKVVTFYNNSGQVGQMPWEDFVNLVNQIP